jgi:hypothetical protein
MRVLIFLIKSVSRCLTRFWKRHIKSSGGITVSIRNSSRLKATNVEDTKILPVKYIPCYRTLFFFCPMD